MTVRPAVAADAETIAGFNRRLAEESEGRVLDPHRVEHGVRSVLADPVRGRYWIAERNGIAFGQCLVTIEASDWGGGTYWWLQSVYVEPDHRGAGVFRGLWDAVVGAAHVAGDVLAIRLYVDRHNSGARAAYERLGMSETPYRIYERPLGVS
ncbi:MAG TPA: GNAT family N-acetyltransferase [Gemmatimonadota bacterium]|nr:GNAT family N-acetyltransferase [Gemmatimonadota bacterium]